MICCFIQIGIVIVIRKDILFIDIIQDIVDIIPCRRGELRTGYYWLLLSIHDILVLFFSLFCTIMNIEVSRRPEVVLPTLCS